MKKVLITGASGFLGRHLVNRLNALGFDCYVSNTKVGNLLNYENLFIYNDIVFDYIYHLAAHTKAGDFCLYHKGEQYEINQLINTNILKYWRLHQPQAKMLAIGTSCSYSPDLSLVEENYLMGQPDSGLYTYAMTKRMLLVGLMSYSEQYKLKYNYYIPSTLYGPGFDLSDSHFIFDIIKKVYNGRYNQNKVVLWGDGYQRRELVYIDDFINVLTKSADVDNCIINVGSDQNQTIREFASIVCEMFEYDETHIEYDTNRYVGVRDKRLDITKLKKMSLYNPTTLNDGLLKTVAYYRDSIKNLS